MNGIRFGLRTIFLAGLLALLSSASLVKTDLTPSGGTLSRWLTPSRQAALRERPPWSRFKSADGAFGRGIAPQSAELPLEFEPNRGQAEYQVRFFSQAGDYALWLTDAGMVLTLPRQERQTGREPRTVTMRLVDRLLIHACLVKAILSTLGNLRS